MIDSGRTWLCNRIITESSTATSPQHFDNYLLDTDKLSSRVETEREHCYFHQSSIKNTSVYFQKQPPPNRVDKMGISIRTRRGKENETRGCEATFRRIRMPRQLDININMVKARHTHI